MPRRPSWMQGDDSYRARGGAIFKRDELYVAIRRAHEKCLPGFLPTDGDVEHALHELCHAFQLRSMGFTPEQSTISSLVRRFSNTIANAHEAEVIALEITVAYLLRLKLPSTKVIISRGIAQDGRKDARRILRETKKDPKIRRRGLELAEYVLDEAWKARERKEDVAT